MLQCIFYVHQHTQACHKIYVKAIYELYNYRTHIGYSHWNNNWNIVDELMLVCCRASLQWTSIGNIKLTADIFFIYSSSGFNKEKNSLLCWGEKAVASYRKKYFDVFDEWRWVILIGLKCNSCPIKYITRFNRPQLVVTEACLVFRLSAGLF